MLMPVNYNRKPQRRVNCM